MLEPKKALGVITNIELRQGVQIDGSGRKIRIKGVCEADLALDWPRN